jgi:endothelin-converting enzyme/putative endopeptidase
VKYPSRFVLGALMLAPAITGGCSTARGGAAARAQTAPAESLAPSGPDLAPVDVTVDPCTDFARFACGISNRNLRTNDAVAWRRPAIERFMTEIASGQHADPAHGTPLLREFYLRCTDRDARAAGLAELREQLAGLARVPTLAELARRLGRLRARGTRLLIDFTPEQPPGQAGGVVAARIGLAPPRLPRQLYAPVHQLVSAYHRHWEALARLSGAVTAGEVDAAARVDAWLATGGPTTPAAADSPRTLTATELAQARFPWSAYLSALDPRVPGPFLIHSAQSLARVDALRDLPLAELRSYARVLLIEQWAEFLDGAFLDEELRFHERAGQGAGRAPAPTNLPASCAALAARDLTPLLADAYLSEMPNPAGEAAARRMFDRLRARLDRRVGRADWLDETAREPAHKRVAGVGLVFVEDVEAPAVALASPPGSFLDLYRRTRERDARRTLGLIGRPWAEEPLTPTLSPGEYFSRANRVWVSPEIVRPPYLRAPGFIATSFGALGAVMGHEIAHAIPAMLQAAAPRPADRTGTASRPPETTAAVSLSARLACLKRRLDSLSPPEAAADSRYRLGESWADRVGVDLALEAMDDEAANAGQSRPLEAWQRDFFVAYAQTLCAVQGDGAPEIDPLRDPHAPAPSRINAAVADAPEFARAFACATGAPMAPVQRCSAW